MAARRDHTETLQRMHSPRGIKSTLEPIADVGALKLDKAAADPLMKAGNSVACRIFRTFDQATASVCIACG